MREPEEGGKWEGGRMREDEKDGGEWRRRRLGKGGRRGGEEKWGGGMELRGNEEKG